MDYREGETDGKRQKRIRGLIKKTEKDGKSGNAQRIQVKVLKNRNGSKGSCILEYYPMFNYLKDTRQPDGEEPEEDIETEGEDSIEWEEK